MIFVFTLSLHSFLEGIGLGPSDDYKRVVLFAVSLLLHKGLESFALGMSIYNASFKKMTAVVIVIGVILLTIDVSFNPSWLLFGYPSQVFDRTFTK